MLEDKPASRTVHGLTGIHVHVHDNLDERQTVATKTTDSLANDVIPVTNINFIFHVNPLLQVLPIRLVHANRFRRGTVAGIQLESEPYSGICQANACATANHLQNCPVVKLDCIASEVPKVLMNRHVAPVLDPSKR